MIYAYMGIQMTSEPMSEKLAVNKTGFFFFFKYCESLQPLELLEP